MTVSQFFKQVKIQNMSRLDNIASYFNEKDRKKNQERAKLNLDGLPEMTREEIRLSCLENDGYETPELNEKLYLHFKGYRKIQCLEAYTGCKALWLESNGIDTICGLDCLTNLRCLYLAKNLISKIQGLENLQHLNSIDLSNNRITIVENLSYCSNLQTLNLSRNALKDIESIEHLTQCPALQTLDLTNNMLEGDLLSFLLRMPSLLSLSINGNPVTQSPGFRKKMIVALPKLGYLDRPIDEQERFFANAFAAGGAEGESLARKEWQEAQKNKRVNEMEVFRKWQKEECEKRAALRDKGHQTSSLHFTEEQLERRQIELDAAVTEEKQMLEIGVSKIAQKYWSGGGQRDLDQVVQELIDSKNVTDGDESGTKVEEIEQSVEDTSVEASGRGGEASARCARFAEGEISGNTYTGVLVGPEDVQVAMCSEESGDEEEDGGESGARDASQSLDNLSGSQVADSEPLSPTVVPRLRETELPGRGQPTATEPYYWTEAMDLALAEYVRKYMFDFEQVAVKMCELGNNSLAKMDLSVDDCRIRWSQLDAKQWADISLADSIAPVNYKIFVQPEQLGQGHGAQPSFQALSSIASGRTPSYLKVPLSFPCVSDFPEDGSDVEDASTEETGVRFDHLD